MSFIITVYTHEGIIMASDSRITYTTYEPNPNGKGALKNYGIQSTDTTYKTFICNSTIGLSTSGASSIKNKPISIYIEDFIAKHVKERPLSTKFPRSLSIIFRSLTLCLTPSLSLQAMTRATLPLTCIVSTCFPSRLSAEIPKMQALHGTVKPSRSCALSIPLPSKPVTATTST